MNSIVRRSVTVAGILTTLLAFPSFVHAGIITIKDVQSCNVNGLDNDLNSIRGGVHCDNGQPFSLTAILDGSIALLVGDSQTPSWNIKNDTGSALDSLTLFYSGALASNSYVDMQISGTGIFAACTATTAANVVTSSANCGAGDKTANDPALALRLVWSGGTGLGINGTFNLGTASFAHAGQDAGCISGTATCTSNNFQFQEASAVPEPSSIVLMSSGLVSVLVAVRRRARKTR